MNQRKRLIKALTRLFKSSQFFSKLFDKYTTRSGFVCYVMHYNYATFKSCRGAHIERGYKTRFIHHKELL